MNLKTALIGILVLTALTACHGVRYQIISGEEYWTEVARSARGDSSVSVTKKTEGYMYGSVGYQPDGGYSFKVLKSEVEDVRNKEKAYLGMIEFIIDSIRCSKRDVDALQALTDQTFSTCVEWVGWFDENAKRLKLSKDVVTTTND